MKTLMFATLAFTCLTTLVCLAQEAAKQDNTKEATAQAKQKLPTASKTVTGCLQKGHEPGELSITGEDGKTWELSSKTVKLGEHVGHQVTVTGSAHRESKAQEKAEEKKEGQVENAAAKEEYGDLRVSVGQLASSTVRMAVKQSGKHQSDRSSHFCRDQHSQNSGRVTNGSRDRHERL